MNSVILTLSNRFQVAAWFLFAAAVLMALPAVSHAQMLNRQLGPGMSGADVSALQTYLAQNTLIYPQGLVTGYYGALTAQAVTQYQIAYDVSPVGRVGPITLAKIAQVQASGLGIDISAATISGVNVVRTGASAQINWTTNKATHGTLYYSTSPLWVTDGVLSHAPVTIWGNTPQSVSTTGSGNSQSITLNNLQLNVPYYYFIEVADATGNVSITLPSSF